MAEADLASYQLQLEQVIWKAIFFLVKNTKFCYVKNPNFKLFFERFVAALNANDISFETTLSYGQFLKKEYNISHPTCSNESLVWWGLSWGIQLITRMIFLL